MTLEPTEQDMANVGPLELKDPGSPCLVLADCKLVAKHVGIN